MLNHYISYHNVDENNCFFQTLFQIKDKSVLKRCFICDEFLVTDKHKAVHNFLKHYEDGKVMPFEEKPLNILKLHGLTIYSIDFRSTKIFMTSIIQRCVLINFLRTVKYSFKPGSKKWIKCSFLIENIQNSL